MGRPALPRGWTRPRVALGAAAALALALSAAPAALVPSSIRAAAAACAIGAAAALARARLGRPAATHRLTVVSRQALSREAGLALVEVDGRALLVGFGGPVQLLDGGPRALPADAPLPPVPSAHAPETRP